MPDLYYIEAAARHMKRPVLDLISAEIDKAHRTLDELFRLPVSSSRDTGEAQVLRELTHNLEVRAMVLKVHGAKCPSGS